MPSVSHTGGGEGSAAIRNPVKEVREMASETAGERSGEITTAIEAEEKVEGEKSRKEIQCY